MHQAPNDTPPPYDSTGIQQQFYYDGKTTVKPGSDDGGNKPPTSSDPSNSSPNVPYMIAGSSYVPQLGTRSPDVYHYVNPKTGEHVTSLLPPDHPEMICLQEGEHVTEAQFGFLGILAAIFWFPLGVGLCLLDRRVRCRRCGAVLENGICGPY